MTSKQQTARERLQQEVGELRLIGAALNKRVNEIALYAKQQGIDETCAEIGLEHLQQASEGVHASARSFERSL